MDAIGCQRRSRRLLDASWSLIREAGYAWGLIIGSRGLTTTNGAVLLTRLLESGCLEREALARSRFRRCYIAAASTRWFNGWLRGKSERCFRCGLHLLVLELVSIVYGRVFWLLANWSLWLGLGLFTRSWVALDFGSRRKR